MRRTMVLAITGAALLAVPGAAGAAQGKRADALERQLGRGVRAVEHRETGFVRFLGTRPGRAIPRPAGVSASAPPRAAAGAFLNRHGRAFGLRDAARELTVSGQQRLRGGRAAVRFQQRGNGVPVVGGELVVEVDANNNVLSASGELLPNAAKAAAGRGVTSSEARAAAIGAVAKGEGVPAAGLRADIPERWIYDARLLGGRGPLGARPVWRLNVTGAALDQMVLVDAELGSVVVRISNIELAKDREVCDANNTRRRLPVHDRCGRAHGGRSGDRRHDVDLAYDFAGDTYDFFAGLGRDSLDDNGMTLVSTVKYCPDPFDCPYANAFWDGDQMVYGEGYAAADDVVGHELTHGVTDFSAHLFYYYQSGAINESLSDVFGEFVDLTQRRRH